MSMKLKDIIEEGIGGFVGIPAVGKMESRLDEKDSASLLKIAKQLVAKEEGLIFIDLHFIL